MTAHVYVSFYIRFLQKHSMKALTAKSVTLCIKRHLPINGVEKSLILLWCLVNPAEKKKKGNFNVSGDTQWCINIKQ